MGGVGSGRKPDETEKVAKRSSRYKELQRLLWNRDLSFPAFIDLALDQQEIDHIDVADLGANRITPPTVAAIRRGENAETLQEECREKGVWWEFRPIMGKEYREPFDPDIVVHRQWDWREREDEEESLRDQGARTPEDDEDEREERQMRRMFRFLRLKIMTSQAQEGDSGIQKALVEMQTRMMDLALKFAESSTARATPPATDAFTQYLITQNANLQLERTTGTRKDPEALTKILDSGLSILGRVGDLMNQRVLKSLGGGGDSVPWIAPVAAILEGFKPFVPEIIDAVRGLRAGTTHARLTEGGETPMPERSPEALEMLNAFVEELRNPARDVQALLAWLASVVVDPSGMTLYTRMALIARSPEALGKLSLRVIDQRLVAPDLWPASSEILAAIRKVEEPEKPA